MLRNILDQYLNFKNGQLGPFYFYLILPVARRKKEKILDLFLTFKKASLEPIFDSLSLYI